MVANALQILGCGSRQKMNVAYGDFILDAPVAVKVCLFGLASRSGADRDALSAAVPEIL
jgi:hypothetical protein